MRKVLFILVLSLVFCFSTNVKAQESIDLAHIEASIAKQLLPQDLSDQVTVVREFNSLIIEGNEAELKRLRKFIVSLDRPLKHVEIEVKLIEFRKDKLKSIRFLRDQLGVNSIAGINSFLDLLPSPIFSSGLFSGFVAGEFPLVNAIKGPVDAGILAGNIPKGLSILDFSLDEWNIFNKNLSFLETKGVIQLHSYPKIVTIGGRSAAININQHNNVVLGSAFRVNEFGVANTQILEAVKAGTNLLITPTVSKSNLITNKIQIDVSENSPQRTIQSDVIVPTTTFRREVNTEIQVKSGQTVAIGGLLFNNDSVNRRGLPFITSIPILGDLLSNRRTEINKTELIVFITPRVLELNDVPVKNLEEYKEIEKKILDGKTKDSKRMSRFIR